MARNNFQLELGFGYSQGEGQGDSRLQNKLGVSSDLAGIPGLRTWENPVQDQPVNTRLPPDQWQVIQRPLPGYCLGTVPQGSHIHTLTNTESNEHE